MPSSPLFPRAGLALACALMLMHGAHAQNDTVPKEPAEPVRNSALDGPLFYQLLRGELELRSGQVVEGHQALIDAARRTRDEALFRRATEAALQQRAIELALQSTQVWRATLPDSLEAARYQLQLLIVMNRPNETVEPLRTLLRLTPAAERSAAITALPRVFERSGDKAQTAKRLEEILKPSLGSADTRVAAQVAIARAWLAAGDSARANELAKTAHAQDPAAELPALLALELMATTPAAESLVQSHLQAKPSSLAIRMVYARVLSAAQRYADAVPQLEAVTRSDNAPLNAWLTLGALHLELKHPREGTAALLQYVQRAQNAPPPVAAPASAPQDDDDDNPATATDRGLTQAYLLLSQAAEQQRDYAGAEAWLAKVTDAQRALEVQSRRASLLAKQGKVQAARELIRNVPEKGPDDQRAKLLAEAQMLREVKQWEEANRVLASANQKFPDDPDLLYEQSMMVEKLNRMDEMERLLRKVIALKPDHHHAYNALGYSLAERNQRLPEARELIKKALDLAPGEPFITDSLGWVEYRLGNRDEALRLLQQAYRSRPDVEIGAHLGEVLWMSGQRDEARRVLRESHNRDQGNEVLKETLARLRVDL
ncbi:tetratricopeptide repeat protein [Piscinibacter gummiphilus]|uniref:Tetratricopeptide repeat protein n=1 Tax=Piscinibacter gummiphilus TaxID=946333 RepID=A0ABZ0D394_9BURK|nr:tetratricopeptide repeat protein [Piscinibacter gummiphilus]WOB09209.1 tetratricopeptide repeat protein [Piscinibacter gummiphilus]